MEIPIEEWQALHIRHCRGEALTPAELAMYSAGKKELEDEEIIAPDLAEIRRQREALSTLSSQTESLRRKRELLDREIASLEAALSDRTKRLLGVGS